MNLLIECFSDLIVATFDLFDRHQWPWLVVMAVLLGLVGVIS